MGKGKFRRTLLLAVAPLGCKPASRGLGETSVLSLSFVRLLAIPWTAERQASLSIRTPRSLFKLMSIESGMPSSHFILCSALLLPSIFPSIRVFSNELALPLSRSLLSSSQRPCCYPRWGNSLKEKRGVVWIWAWGSALAPPAPICAVRGWAWGKAGVFPSSPDSAVDSPGQECFCLPWAVRRLLVSDPILSRTRFFYG